MIAAGIADYKQCEELPNFASDTGAESLILKESDFEDPSLLSEKTEEHMRCRYGWTQVQHKTRVRAHL
jgi:hypothetical protein